MDKSRIEPTIFLIEKISFSLKFFSGHFYGQSFIKTVRGPFITVLYINLNMCFGCLEEPSRSDDSFEHPQHMFWLN